MVAEKKSEMSKSIRGQNGHLGFPIGQKHKLGRGRCDFTSCNVESCSVVAEKKSKMSQPIKGQDGLLGFSECPEKHKLCSGR